MQRLSRKRNSLDVGGLPELDELTALVAVARERSFTRAARALSTPKSTLSKRIASLEARLHMRLLQRTTRAVTATEAGRVLVERAARILADLEDAGRAVLELDASPRGLVRLTTPALMAERLVAPALMGLLARAPELAIEVVATDRVVDVVGEGFDVALRTGRVADSSLVGRRLRPWDNIVCASPAYVARHSRPQRPEDLRDHACIAFRRDAASPSQWSFTRARRSVTVVVAGRFTANSQELAREAALAGFGIANLNRFVVEYDVRRGALVQLLPEWSVPAGELHILYPGQRLLGSSARAVIDVLTETLSVEPLPRERLQAR
ncbi:MAG TPA: LysR family transcriptional regulator [Polyangiaceae bacterium]|nr:LysR family transcriptional regulator [Polyangiaceae bacterium]